MVIWMQVSTDKYKLPEVVADSIVAQDIDWNSIYMTYIQLSLNGLDAICIQGNTLTNEVVNSNEKLRTPKNRGLLL